LPADTTAHDVTAEITARARDRGCAPAADPRSLHQTGLTVEDAARQLFTITIS
jgi:hypothetical protein